MIDAAKTDWLLTQPDPPDDEDYEWEISVYHCEDCGETWEITRGNCPLCGGQITPERG